MNVSMISPLGLSLSIFALENMTRACLISTRPDQLLQAVPRRAAHPKSIRQQDAWLFQLYFQTLVFRLVLY